MRLSFAGLRETEYVYELGKPWLWSVNVSHSLNSAIVNGRLYYIEPQTDEIWAKENLD